MTILPLNTVVQIRQFCLGVVSCAIYFLACQTFSQLLGWEAWLFHIKMCNVIHEKFAKRNKSRKVNLFVLKKERVFKVNFS